MSRNTDAIFQMLGEEIQEQITDWLFLNSNGLDGARQLEYTFWSPPVQSVPMRLRVRDSSLQELWIDV